MRRLSFISLLILVTALCLVHVQGYAAELKRILYGTTASPSHLPIWVAKDAGYFEKHGLNVEPVQVRGGSLITLAILTGDLPFSGAGAESVIAARASGQSSTGPASDDSPDRPPRAPRRGRTR